MSVHAYYKIAACLVGPPHPFSVRVLAKIFFLITILSRNSGLSNIKINGHTFNKAFVVFRWKIIK